MDAWTRGVVEAAEWVARCLRTGEDVTRGAYEALNAAISAPKPEGVDEGWIREARERCRAATPGPWEWCVWNPERDPVEMFREHLSHGSGRVHGSWAPNHEKSVGEHPNPEHAVMPCLTGNGPDSEANAVFISHARDDLPRSLDEIARLRAALGQRPEGVDERETVWSLERYVRGKKMAEGARVRASSEREAIAEAKILFASDRKPGDPPDEFRVVAWKARAALGQQDSEVERAKAAVIEYALLHSDDDLEGLALAIRPHLDRLVALLAAEQGEVE